ncbi:MAG: Flp pilus assembly complex ATPase component TadA [Planctomycetes bacterium]|nr:Flp pilus assembly complex ATPase component TadA [Planctomycetota bacterium]
MPRLIVQNLESGHVRQINLNVPEFTIGKLEDNDLVLTGPGVSRHHATVVQKNGAYFVRDMESANGTFVNGNRLGGEPLGIEDGTAILIGGFEILFRADRVRRKKEDEKEKEEFPGTTGPAIARESEADRRVEKEGEEIPLEVRRKIHERLLADKRLKLMDFTKMSEEEARNRTKEVVLAILEELKKEIPSGVSRPRLIQEVLDEALALGPLEDLIADPNINEIMVNRFDRIYVERAGKGMELTDLKFIDDNQVIAVIQRIIAPIGRRINETSPLVDARLRDGSRVNAIIPPLAVSGPSLTIRKFPLRRLGIEDLIRYGSITDKMAKFLHICVTERKNVVISGGTGSGKTTLLNVVSSFIPGHERIVTIEDVAELRLPQEHIVSLETKPPNLEGEGAIEIRDLVRNSLRMRPDRIIIGECRGGEALDMLQAMNTGHDGSLTTVHANTPLDALRRLETLVLFAGMELPSLAIRQQISSAVEIIVQQTRLRDGTRRVIAIAEVLPLDEGDFQIASLFEFRQSGLARDGKILGQSIPTGHIPEFIHDMRKRGLEVDMKIFGTEV